MAHDWLPEEAEGRTEISYPLNNRWYTAKYPQALHAPRSSGVYSSDNDLILTPAGGLRVRLSMGIAYLRFERFRGATYAQTDPDGMTFDVPPPHGTLTRIDRIAIRFDYILNDIFALYKVGTPGLGAPALQRDEEAYELHVQEVVARPGTLEIRGDMINDLRSNEHLCGIVRDNVERIPTQALYDSWWAWFSETTMEAEAFRAWLVAFRNSNETELNNWMTDFKLRSEDGFSTWFNSFTQATTTTVANWYNPFRENWETTLQEFMNELMTLLDSEVAASLLGRILTHEDRTPFNSTVHGLRYQDETLQLQTPDGWIIVGGAQIGYTAMFFDMQNFTALQFDLINYTAQQFDSITRTVT